MPYNRFYALDPLQVDTQISLEGTEHHHMAHVMRLSVGEEVELVNGQGTLAKAVIASLDKKRASLHIQESFTQPKLPPQIALAIPFLRPAKLEWIVEKATELGVDSFLFYPADLGEKKDLSAHQLERLHALLIAAMKQSGRLFTPHLDILSHFSHLFKKNIPLYYGDTKPSAPLLKEVAFPLLFVTGPESGLSERENLLLEQTGHGIKLNEHILRAETAPIAAAALLNWKKLLVMQ